MPHLPPLPRDAVPEFKALAVHNHFNQQRHLYSRKNFKLNRSAALAEWRQLAA